MAFLERWKPDPQETTDLIRGIWFWKLAPLIRSTGKFEIDERETDNKRGKLIYVR